MTIHDYTRPKDKLLIKMCERFKCVAGQKMPAQYSFSFPAIFCEVEHEFWTLSRLPFSSHFHNFARARTEPIASPTFIYLEKNHFLHAIRALNLSRCDVQRNSCIMRVRVVYARVTSYRRACDQRARSHYAAEKTGLRHRCKITIRNLYKISSNNFHKNHQFMIHSAFKITFKKVWNTYFYRQN